MNLPPAIRTRPSRTRLPISQQGLVDNPQKRSRRTPGRTVWQSRSIDVDTVYNRGCALLVFCCDEFRDRLDRSVAPGPVVPRAASGGSGSLTFRSLMLQPTELN